jgi:hypothetical protein
MSIPRKQFFQGLFILFLSGFFAGCAQRPFEALPREELFTIPIGKMEDQIDLFQTPRTPSNYKTTMFMRDGSFYIGNGASFKVMEFTSYGDLLSLVYNPDENPGPVILQRRNESGAVANRRAYPYSFRNVGAVAVSRAKVLYVEDRLPAERSIFDEKLGITLNRVVIRFSDGEYRGYLGQEGIGGTPFPYVERIDVTNRDEVVVLCRTMTSWIVFWYSDTGKLLATSHISPDTLPVPQGEKILPSLETILPDPDTRRLYLKLNYYKEGVDSATGIKYGIENVASRIYWLNVETSQYEGFVDLPENIRQRRGTGFFETREVEYLFEFVGVTSGGNIFLLSREENNTHQLLILQADGKVLRRRAVIVEDSELLFSVFHVSSEGILSALLAADTGAKIVWWRSDTLMSGR